MLEPEATTPVAGSRSDWGCDYVVALAKLFDYSLTTLHQQTDPGSLFALSLQVKLVIRR